MTNTAVFWATAPTVRENLDIDEAMARTAGRSGERTLRFWWGGPPAVVLGASERPEQTVYLDECARLGVEVLPRVSGGGSVLQTEDVLNYTLVVPGPSLAGLKASYGFGADLVCSLLDILGIRGAPASTSDVVVGDRKISGNAQCRRWKSVLLHGTVLVGFDYDLADAVLRQPTREPEYRGGRTHRDFLVTLRELRVDAGRQVIERAALEAAHRLMGPWSPSLREMRMTVIRILHTSVCDNAPPAEVGVREAVEALGLDATLEIVEVVGDVMAREVGLRGSPTITIDGVDLETEPPPINSG